MQKKNVNHKIHFAIGEASRISSFILNEFNQPYFCYFRSSEHEHFRCAGRSKSQYSDIFFLAFSHFLLSSERCDQQEEKSRLKHRRLYRTWVWVWVYTSVSILKEKKIIISLCLWDADDVVVRNAIYNYIHTPHFTLFSYWYGFPLFMQRSEHFVCTIDIFFSLFSFTSITFRIRNTKTTPKNNCVEKRNGKRENIVNDYQIVVFMKE